MSHPLLTNSKPPNLQGKIDVPPLGPGICLTGPDDIRDWLAKSLISIKAPSLIFGYSAGTVGDATADDRDWPRFLFDENGRYIGLALWLPHLQAWTIPGQPGQLMTLVRTLSTPALDLAARPLAGWHLADGGTTGIPNLSAIDGFWGAGYYTVGYLG